jgi:hypothetical protein
MITGIKEINKYFRDAKWNLNKAIELAKKNIVVGEIRFPAAQKIRKPRKPTTTIDSMITAVQKKPRGRKPKNLPDVDKDGYMNKRGPVIEE